MENYRGHLKRDLLIGITAGVVTGASIIASESNKSKCRDLVAWQDKGRVSECHDSHNNIVLEGIDTPERTLPEWVQWIYVDEESDVYMYFSHGPIMIVGKIDLMTGDVSEVGHFYLDD